MAEIHVQRKRGGIWPVVIGLIALLLVVWAVVALWNDDEAEPTIGAVGTAPARSGPAREPGTSDTQPPAVAAFLTFAQAQAAASPGPAHDYAAEGIRRLSAALDAIVETRQVAGDSVRERLEGFQRTADRIQENPEATDHANRVRDAFMGAADLMAAVQQSRWSDVSELRNDIEQVRLGAAAIDGARPLLDQTTAMREFFDRAAAAVRRMAQQT